MLKYSLCVSHGASRSEPVLFRGEYGDAFLYAKQLGFEGIEIHLRDAKDVDANQIIRESQNQKVAVAGIATGLAQRIDHLSLIDSDKSRRQEAIDRIKGHLDLAAVFGCTVIIGSMRSNIPIPEQGRQCRALLLDSVKSLADYIENKNCSIVFEAINRYENNYLNTAEETSSFLNQINSKKIKMLLDTFHMNIEETNMERAIFNFGKQLGHVHLADNTRRYPGSGQIDFSKIIKALAEIHYGGWCSMEYFPLPSEAAAARAGLRHVQKIEQNFQSNEDIPDQHFECNDENL